MAFELLERAPLRRAKLTNHVAVARYRKSNMACVTLSADVHARMGAPVAYAVYMGNGPDTGTLLLVPVNSKSAGRAASAQGTNQIKVNFPAKTLGLSHLVTTPVPFAINQNGIVVTLPQFTEQPAKQPVNDRPARIIEAAALHA